MKNSFFCYFRRSDTFCCPEIEKSRIKQFLAHIFFLRKLISRGSPEVTFCSWTKFQRAYGRSVLLKIVRKKILYYRRLMANLGRPTWDCQIWILGGSDMDSGHVGGSISNNKYKSCIKTNIVYLIIGTSPKNPKNIYIYIYIYIYKIPCTSPHSYPRIGGSMVRVRGFPERDILSLRTLGLGLDRFGEFFRRRRGPIFGKSGT